MEMGEKLLVLNDSCCVLLFIIFRAWLNIPCPFSFGEDGLRNQIQATSSEHWIRESFHLLALRKMEKEQFRVGVTGFGILVLGAFWIAGPLPKGRIE
jgi:hypothetical protein